MNKENMIELLEDFIDFLKDKENEKKEEKVVEEEMNDDDNFDKTIGKIAKGE
ncbi:MULTISPECIES: hypothetical protein [Bacteria]|uniref:hypothetical protein n=1 Tax=Bacteria TaxID=2 RepID=UPI00072C4424|nr:MULTISPECIES: hypothetical protein [Bacteria]KSV85710.1 hypothetical protein N184_32735 [Sinorhizobium sp. GL28]